MLASAVVLQALHGLSDFETVQELRCDLRWKAACGLGLLDTGFDPSLLTYFRRRLRGSDDPERLFSKVREVVAATGVLKGKHRRALDSTVLDDAVATQDTVTQLISGGAPGDPRGARRAGGVEWAQAMHRTVSTGSRASRRSPGMMRRPGPRWSVPWSPML